jgi:hypothetical protein
VAAQRGGAHPILRGSGHVLIGLPASEVPSLAQSGTGGHPLSGPPCPRYAYACISHVFCWDSPLSVRAPLCLHERPSQQTCTSARKLQSVLSGGVQGRPWCARHLPRALARWIKNSGKWMPRAPQTRSTHCCGRSSARSTGTTMTSRMRRAPLPLPGPMCTMAWQWISCERRLTREK